MRVLREAMHQKQFAPAYYFHGDDEYLKQDWLRRLIDAAVDPATRDFNLDRRRGDELDAATLASLLGAPPLMATRRMIVIRDVTGLRKAARKVLDDYLRAPTPDVLLVVTAPAEARVDAGLASHAVSLEFKPLSGGLVGKWIETRAAELGTTIASGAAALLQDAVGDDLALLNLELEKLAALTGSGGAQDIDERAVAAVVGVRREETLGGLLDAVAERDARAALGRVAPVLQHPKVTAVFVVMTLTTQFLALAVVHARKVPVPARSGEFYALLKRGSSNVAGRAWGEAVSAWTRTSSKWSAADIDHAFRVLLATDLALKGSRVSSEEQVLSSAILDICAGSARRHAA